MTEMEEIGDRLYSFLLELSDRKKHSWSSTVSFRPIKGIIEGLPRVSGNGNEVLLAIR